MNKMYFNRTMMKNAPQQHHEEYYSVGARMKETTPGGVKQHTNILIHRCSPSTATTDDIGGAGAVGASEAAIHSSKSSLSRTGWSCEDVLSTSSQSPSEPSLAQTHAKPLNNPPLQWTTEELRLVSRMREGMMKSCRRKRSKKPKDAPRRPLSAYNIFFREERARILSHEGMIMLSAAAAGGKKESFQNLSKIIGARWKAMTGEEERASYTDRAAVDAERYKNEMTEYRERCSSLRPCHGSRKKKKKKKKKEKETA